MKIQNAKQMPRRYFGLHMAEGTAEYPQKDGGAKRYLILENTMKAMDPTFEGCPVFVGHRDTVTPADIEGSDGIVVKSFYNSTDGKHWVEFLVTSDKGHEAISKGWRLSNAYHPQDISGGGLHHGVQYDGQIMNGRYEHLAIVDNPRYSESVVFTPEQFKEYNEKKSAELKRLTNSGESKVSKFTFWKREKIENASGANLEESMVTLPKSKKDLTIAQAIEDADTLHNMQGYASDDHVVKVNDSEEFSVGELKNRYNSMCGEKKANSAKEEEDKKKKENEAKAAEDKDKKENEDKDKDKDKKENSLTETQKQDFFKMLKDAPTKVENASETPVLSSAEAQVNRGKNLFGSGK